MKTKINQDYCTNSTQPSLSIIIPAYNEELRIEEALINIDAWRKTFPFTIEILVVENGSQDRTTEIAEGFAQSHENVRILHSIKGKGAAVRKGVFHSRGDLLFICDTDLSMPISEVEKFIPWLQDGYDLVIGSREVPGAERLNEPFYRHLMGRTFNLVVSTLIFKGVHDTQCGFKLFTRDAAHKIFIHQTITGWTFDVEAIYLAQKYGYRVYELPIVWYFDADSRVSPIRDTFRMLWDVVKIRFNSWWGIYEDNSRSSLTDFEQEDIEKFDTFQDNT